MRIGELRQDGAPLLGGVDEAHGGLRGSKRGLLDLLSVAHVLVRIAGERAVKRLGRSDNFARAEAKLIDTIANGVERHVPGPDGADDAATKPLLKAIDAPQFALRQRLDVDRQVLGGSPAAISAVQRRCQLADVVWNPPEVVARCAPAARPTHAFPLQGMVGHAAAFTVAACSP